MNNNDDVQTSSKQKQTKTFEKPINKSLKHPPKNSKQQNRPKSIQKQPSTKPTCTRCGFTQLIDITRHEFPKQKGLVFECASCGNNSIRSNVSADERRRRLAKVAADHLHKIECHFCHEIFHSHNDYLNHLRTDHESNKPM
jgi:predicted nucleic-acid-binding Zn-ribbon protein